MLDKLYAMLWVAAVCRQLLSVGANWVKDEQNILKCFKTPYISLARVSITPRKFRTYLLYLEIIFDAEEIGFFPWMTRTHVATNQFHIKEPVLTLSYPFPFHLLKFKDSNNFGTQIEF